MTFGTQAPRLREGATWKFGIEGAVVTNHAPVGRDSYPPRAELFLRRLGRNPQKDPRGQRARDLDPMRRGKAFADLTDGDQLAFPDPTNFSIDQARSRNEHRSPAAAVSDDPRSLRLLHFFAPGNGRGERHGHNITVAGIRPAQSSRRQDRDRRGRTRRPGRERRRAAFVGTERARGRHRAG